MLQHLRQQIHALRQMLEVVQHEQQAFSPQVAEKLLFGVSSPSEGEVERVGDGRDDEIGGGERLEGNEAAAVGKQ